MDIQNFKPTIDQLENSGATLWQSPDGKIKRYYFNDLMRFSPIEYNLYKTGNISSAWYKNSDRGLSNSKALDYRRTEKSGAIYYDVNRECWGSKYVCHFDEFFENLVSQIFSTENNEIEGE